ncbi:TPA: hypothetical protein RSV29_000771 [Pseudomonas aeruginosa]|nr:hypothetical protein [Pseudomonas aeruginosa]
MNKANECTCPSGDGSLVHPCPAHPAVEQAGGDERAADAKPCATRCPDCGEHDLMPGDLCACGYETDPATGYACSECDGSGEGCVGEVCRECDGSGWFVTPDQARAALAQPSPAQAEQAEAERPEVVAYADPVAFATFKERGHEGGVAGREWMWAEPGAALVAMSRTDECERIVGELRADRDSWAEQAEQRLADWDEMRKERDAALARVAELERQEPVATVAKVPGEDWNSLDFHRDLQHMQPGTKLYAAPVAQAQQLNDLDKQCRDDVARALGLRPNQERGFAWSYLLASIKSCVKASGDSAQAQHSVPEEFSFEYRHPNGESHTVTVSRDQVINEMPDFLFEALCSKFCNCEPAGETNVVECCCDEYAEEFKLLAAAPGNSAQHSVPGDIMRDAQRYRWLRDQQFYFSFSTENSDAGISSCTAGMSSRFKNLSWVDAAIDSAIAAAPGKEGV